MRKSINNTKKFLLFCTNGIEDQKLWMEIKNFSREAIILPVLGLAILFPWFFIKAVAKSTLIMSGCEANLWRAHWYLLWNLPVGLFILATAGAIFAIGSFIGREEESVTKTTIIIIFSAITIIGLTFTVSGCYFWPGSVTPVLYLGTFILGLILLIIIIKLAVFINAIIITIMSKKEKS